MTYDARRTAVVEAHPAQPSTADSSDVVGLLDEQMATLENVRDVLRLSRPTRAKKDAMMRHLSGVLASLETIRLALK